MREISSLMFLAWRPVKLFNNVVNMTIMQDQEAIQAKQMTSSKTKLRGSGSNNRKRDSTRRKKRLMGVRFEYCEVQSPTGTNIRPESRLVMLFMISVTYERAFELQAR